MDISDSSMCWGYGKADERKDYKAVKKENLADIANFAVSSAYFAEYEHKNVLMLLFI